MSRKKERRRNSDGRENLRRKGDRRGVGERWRAGEREIERGAEGKRKDDDL